MNLVLCFILCVFYFLSFISLFGGDFNLMVWQISYDCQIKCTSFIEPFILQA